MRFRAPYKEDIFDWIKMVVMLPIVAPFLAIAWIADAKQRAFGPDCLIWRPWFAWFPVRLEGKMVWMEWIERIGRIEMFYRFPSPHSKHIG